MGFYGTGLHAIPIPGNEIPKAGGGRLRLRKDQKWVFVDTRRGRGGQESEPTGLCLPSGIDRELATPKRGDIRRAGLFIDLGSTRTLGVVVPDLDATGEAMTCEVLDLIDYVGVNHEEGRPFSSHVVLEEMAEEISKDTRPLSEVRTGKIATELYDVAAGELARQGGGVAKVLASSPKRLITRSETDPAWRQVVRQGPGGEIRPYELVPSRLVGMQVVELVEQAERMLNSKGDQRAYRVTEVHVTYPPGWLGPVQEMYRQLIQKEMDAWARKRALDVRVEMGCSEALGALVFHWYNRVLKEPGMLEPHPGQDGRKKIQWEEKLGVVDVGGGTTDLLVENIKVDTIDPLKTRVSFTPACRRSVETAGDELVRRVAGEIVLPWLVTQLFKPQGDRKALRQYFGAPEHGAEKRRWMRKHLLEIAQFFIQKSTGGSLSSGEQNELRPHFKEIYAACKGHLARIRNSARIGEEGAKLSDDNFAQLGKAILEAAQRAVPTLAEDIFGGIASDFSVACRDLKCEEVKLSGKTMEYAVVENVFRKAFEEAGFQSQAVTPLVGEEIAPLLRQGLGGMQTISDSKYATVWGCMCKRWMDDQKSHLSRNVEFTMNEISGELEWGVHGINARLTAESWEHRMKVAPNMEIPLISLPVALSYTTRSGRNGREEEMFPVRMYQLGFKRHPFQGLALKGIAKVMLKEDEKTGFVVERVVDGAVEAGGVTGRLRPEDLEVTLALDYALSSFWLDAGVIEIKEEMLTNEKFTGTKPSGGSGAVSAERGRRK